MKPLSIHSAIALAALFVSPVVGQPSIEWQRALGGSAYDGQFSSIIQTSDGGYILAGDSHSNDGDVSGNHGGRDYWVAKLSSTGLLQWQRCYGGSGDEVPHAICQTQDGGYIIAGYSTSADGEVADHHGDSWNHDCWIVKITVDGSIEWAKSYGGTKKEIANEIQETTDGGYIVAGWASSMDGDVTELKGNYNFWIFKLDATGNIQWDKTYGGTRGDEAKSIQQTADGGYIVAGYTYSDDKDVVGHHMGAPVGNEVNMDYWIVKLASDGTAEWKSTIGGSGYDEVLTIRQTVDGGYIACGHSTSNDGDAGGTNGNEDFWFVKLDAAGKVVWQKLYGGSNVDIPAAMALAHDGGFIAVGYTMSSDGYVSGRYGARDYWVAKVKADGSFDWQWALGGGYEDIATAVAATADGGYIISGNSMSFDGEVSVRKDTVQHDFWIIKLAPESSGVDDLASEHPLLIFPNPIENTCTIDGIDGAYHYSVWSITGVKLDEGIGYGVEELDLSSYAVGTYTIKITSDAGVEVNRSVVKK